MFGPLLVFNNTFTMAHGGNSHFNSETEKEDGNMGLDYDQSRNVRVEPDSTDSNTYNNNQSTAVKNVISFNFDHSLGYSTI